MYVFDDDMIVGRDYFRLLRIMAKQFPTYTGLLYTNDRHNNKEANLKRVREKAIARLWGHYMWRNNWLKFKDDHKIYYDYIRQFDFFEIRRLQRSGEVKRPKNIGSLSDDVIVNVLCRAHGIQKLVPKVSRARYIGKVGVVTYKTDNLWNKRGMEHQRSKITYNSDRKLNKFVKAG